MKIIQDKRPLGQFNYPFRLTCCYCKSELEVEDGDVQERTGDSERGQFTYWFLNCPACNTRNHLSPSKK